MPISTPQYIASAGVQDPLLKYTWDDWRLEEVFESEDHSFHDRMKGLSFRANIAFTNACGEWVIHRYDLLSDDPIPLQNMEAAWAGLIDPTYWTYWEPPDEDWLGPIRGALSLAIIFSLESVGDAFQYTDPALSSYRVSNLAEHIMTSPEPFRTWREKVVGRLEGLYPLNEDDPLGDVVPREALDPNFDFEPEMTEALIQAYLDGLQPGMNTFLRSAADMVHESFKGIPYKFNLEADRIARNDY